MQHLKIYAARQKHMRPSKYICHPSKYIRPVKTPQSEIKVFEKVLMEKWAFHIILSNSILKLVDCIPLYDCIPEVHPIGNGRG